MIDFIMGLILIAVGCFLIFMGGAIFFELAAIASTMLAVEAIGWGFAAVLSILSGLLCFALLTEM